MKKYLLRFGPEFVVTALSVLGVASVTALSRECNGLGGRVRQVSCPAVEPYTDALMRHFGVVALIALGGWVAAVSITLIARRKPLLERIARDEIAAAAQKKADLDAIDRLLEIER